MITDADLYNEARRLEARGEVDRLRVVRALLLARYTRRMREQSADLAAAARRAGVVLEPSAAELEA